MPEFHYKYGGSTIERIELCPGSANACSAIGDVPAGGAAQRGTRIHARIEQLWANAEDPNRLASDEEIIALSIVERLGDLLDEHGFDYDKVAMELPVTLHEISPLAGGSIDHVAFKCFGELLIADTKTGYNYVSAEKNLQMLFYACCFMQGLDPFTRASINKITVAILQPDQIDNKIIQIREWSLTPDELAVYESRFAAAISNAELNPDYFIAGEHCEEKYCKARTTCPAYKNYLSERTLGAFASFLPADSSGDSISERGSLLSQQARSLKAIIKWCAQVQEDIKTELMKNKNSVPGWKLVDAYGNRTWKDEDALNKAAKDLKIKPDEFRPRSMVSPAQFEKILKSKKLELDMSALTERPYIGVRIAEATEDDLVQFSPENPI